MIHFIFSYESHRRRDILQSQMVWLESYDLGTRGKFKVRKKNKQYIKKNKIVDKFHIMQLDHIRFVKSSFYFWPIIRFSVFPAQF